MKKEKPVWLKRSKEEIETLIEKLARKGLGPEKIGLELRDRYGIPSSKFFVKSISAVLKEKGLYGIPSDLTNLVEKAKKLKEHLAKNKKDKVAKRGLQLTISKINKLARYYKKKKILDEKWKF